MNIFNLSNKVALVTGASYGIGFAIAKGLAEAGAKIAFNARREDLVKQGVEDFKKSGITAY
jgi:gluconate 5-dehydrogenase